MTGIFLLRKRSQLYPMKGKTGLDKKKIKEGSFQKKLEFKRS